MMWAGGRQYIVSLEDGTWMWVYLSAFQMLPYGTPSDWEGGSWPRDLEEFSRCVWHREKKFTD